MNELVAPANVVILGCGRSGTSIFGELFYHLPPYRYYSEPVYQMLIDMDRTSPVAVKVPRSDPGYPPSQGLSVPLDHLNKIMSKPIIFWQVRHPLDTICSLKVGISKNWGHHPRPPDWQDWLNRPLIERCAHHWRYINSVGYAQVKDICHITRFEEMLNDTCTFVRKVLSKINLDIDDKNPDLLAWIDRVQDSNNEKFVEAETSRAYSTEDHSVKVGRWKENLTHKEIKTVLPMVSESALQFGYKI